MYYSLIQYQIYMFCSKGSKEVVREFLNSVNFRAAIEADHREWDRRRQALAESKAVQLIMEELMLEVSGMREGGP